MAIAESLGTVAAGRAEAPCAHCGLDCPPGESFCCAGCATAWAVIHASGLDAYYGLPERRGAAVEPSGRKFEEFDHPTFHALYVRTRADGLAETDLYLEGVHCASCVWLVERTPRLAPGLARAELDVRRALVRVAWDPARTPLSAIARLLDELGYRPHPHRGARADDRRRAEDRAMLARVGVAFALALNTMLAALALYSGWFGGMDPSFRHYFRWVSLAIATPAVFGPGLVFFRGAGAALRTRTLHMDLPIAIAIAAGYARGAINTVTGRGPIYLDGVAMLVFLLLVGRFLQQRAQRAAADSAELLHALSPSTARVLGEGGPRDVPAEALLPGMEIEVRAGETFPADGTVERGRSGVDLSLLTGESRPVEVAPGTRVWAGTVNRTSTLAVRVERAGEATRLGRILGEVEAGAARRARFVRLADRLSGAFVAVVLLLAATTAAIWWRTDPSRAIDHAIALLIVTCPCALALATPLAVSVAIGRAARRGILVKGGEVLETLAHPGLLVLDKTGTITEGRTSLVSWQGPDWARALVLAVERHATHPVAAGFAAAWPSLDVPEATEVRLVPGEGIAGTVQGRRVRVGSRRFVARGGPPDPANSAAVSAGLEALPAAAESPDDALTPVYVAVDGVPVGLARFGDPIRAEARATLDRLRARGWRLRILSGDHPDVVAAVGRAVGIAPDDCRGGATPEDKLHAIEADALRGPVVMVGDGINDAAAIARASAGIGVRGGAEACISAADVFLARPGLEGLSEAVEGASRTLAVIRRNILFAIAYNVVGVTLAMTGRIDPLIAAILMPASSLSVVLASWRSRTFDREIP